MRPNSRRPNKAAELPRVLELGDQGKTLRQIEYLTGVPATTVRRWLIGGDTVVQPYYDRASRRPGRAVG